MAMFCPRCGTQNFENAQVCQQCSVPLPQRPPSNSYGNQPYGNQPQPPHGYQPAQGYQPPQAPAYGVAPYGSYQQQGYGYGMAPAPNYAGAGKRFVAALLDGLVCGAAMLPGIFFLIMGAAMSDGGSRSAQETGASLAMLGFLVMWGGYLLMLIFNIYLLGKNGATLGKRWMSIKVLDDTGQPLGFGKALLREVVKIALSNLCFLLMLWPLWDKEKQGLYDKILNTHVYES
jgi:uncharacterized RDD family membrane protein YckC